MASITEIQRTRDELQSHLEAVLDAPFTSSQAYLRDLVAYVDSCSVLRPILGKAVTPQAGFVEEVYRGSGSYHLLLTGSYEERLGRALEAVRATAALDDTRYWQVTQVGYGQVKRQFDDFKQEIVVRLVELLDQHLGELEATKERRKRVVAGIAAPIWTEVLKYTVVFLLGIAFAALASRSEPLRELVCKTEPLVSQ